MVWHLDVGLSHPGAVGGFQGFGCSPMKAVHDLSSERKLIIAFASGNRRLVLTNIGETFFDCKFSLGLESKWQYRGKISKIL